MNKVLKSWPRTYFFIITPERPCFNIMFRKKEVREVVELREYLNVDKKFDPGELISDELIKEFERLARVYFNTQQIIVSK